MFTFTCLITGQICYCESGHRVEWVRTMLSWGIFAATVSDCRGHLGRVGRTGTGWQYRSDRLGARFYIPEPQ